jgi:hypothetical protein
VAAPVPEPLLEDRGWCAEIDEAHVCGIALQDAPVMGAKRGAREDDGSPIPEPFVDAVGEPPNPRQTLVVVESDPSGHLVHCPPRVKVVRLDESGANAIREEHTNGGLAGP